MRILGIDPGTGITGFGVIDIKRGKPSMVAGGVIRTIPHTPLPERLKIIHTDLVGLIREFEPEVMSVEK